MCASVVRLVSFVCTLEPYAVRSGSCPAVSAGAAGMILDVGWAVARCGLYAPIVDRPLPGAAERLRYVFISQRRGATSPETRRAGLDWSTGAGH